MTAAAAVRFLQSLEIPEGPKAGQRVKLAPFQRQFVKGALARDVNTAVLSIGRGNAKTALSSGLALAALVGQPFDRSVQGCDPNLRRQRIARFQTQPVTQ